MDLGPATLDPPALAARVPAAPGDDDGLRECSRWFVRLRWIAVAGVAAAVWIADRGLGLLDRPECLYGTAFLMAAFNLATAFVGRPARPVLRVPARILLHVQIGLDLLFLTLLLHFAGGIGNPFAFFYVFLVVISGILLGRRAGYGVAAAAILLLSGMTALEGAGFARHYALRGFPDPRVSPLAIAALLIAFAFTVLVLCYFTDQVVGALRASWAKKGEADALHRAVLDSMREGLVYFDRQGGVVSCNPAARGLHGCDGNGGNGACRCGDERVNSHTVAGAVREILDGRRDRLVCENACGERIVRSTFRPVPGPDGRTMGVVWGLVDMTEIRRLQMEVLQHERSAVLAEISAYVAHDLGNVLDGTLNGLRILESSTADPVECARWARELRGRTEQAMGVIRGLVELSRGKTRSREPVDVEDVVRRAGHMVSFRARQKGVRCEVAALPVPAVEGDGVMLTLAVMNLLLNALDAVSSAGRVLLDLRLGTGDPARVEIACRDEGCGIAPEDLERIFDPFFTTKGAAGGTGLGLTIARRVAREHGGDLTVTSHVGKGSTFVLTLPATAPAETSPGNIESRISKSEPPIAQIQGNNSTISQIGLGKGVAATLPPKPRQPPICEIPSSRT